MILQVGTAPAAEPVSTTEIKSHLRIDFAGEDTLLASYLLAARETCELESRRAFITQTLKLYLEAWPAGDCLQLPRPPLQSVTSIAYTDSDGNAGTMSASDYIVDGASEPGRIVLGHGKSWPSTTLRPGPSIVITYVAGYGDAEDVPQRYKQAIQLLAGHYYENREAVIAAPGVNPVVLPMAVRSLLMLDRGSF